MTYDLKEGLPMDENSERAEYGPEGHSRPHVHENARAVKNRLARIGGHLRAVERMVEDGRDCSEILIQLAAIRSALNNVCKLILRDHMDHCIVDALEDHDASALEELSKAIDLLMK